MILAAELVAAYLAGAVSAVASGVYLARRQFRKMRSPRVLS